MAGVKICGLRDIMNLEVAINSNAEFAGFVFYSKSPRALELDDAAGLIKQAANRIKKVGLFVDPQDDFIAAIMQVCPLDMLQLHGQESPARVAEIRSRFCLPIMKAIPLVTRDDLRHAAPFEPVADWLLFDAKMRKGDDRPGGNARAFDWRILQDVTFTKPWMLAGGLDAENVRQAIATTKAKYVDVSSGVESGIGKKDSQKITRFIEAALNV